jgi:aspartate carbamoyltransferase catalytic subunit
MISEVKLKKLLISGDLAGSKEAKSLLGALKSKGLKVEIVGPVI